MSRSSKIDLADQPSVRAITTSRGVPRGSYWKSSGQGHGPKSLPIVLVIQAGFVVHQKLATLAILETNVVKQNFLGTLAPSYAILTLLLEIAMGVGLLMGAFLARRRRFRQHAWCQSVIVLLNLAVIVLVMIPSFRVQVIPKIPLKLGKAYYALATAHATLGTITEIAGLYLLLAAGTSILPERFRITKYKLWMRTVLVLWWVVLLMGFATYARWYVPHLFRK